MTEKPARGQETAQAVLDIIRMNPEYHNQGVWESYCGTTRCVAGWAAKLHEYDIIHAARYTGMTKLGCQLLDIDTVTGAKLFSGTSDEEAVHALEYLAKGNEIDWEAVYSDHKTTEGRQS